MIVLLTFSLTTPLTGNLAWTIRRNEQELHCNKARARGEHLLSNLPVYLSNARCD